MKQTNDDDQVGPLTLAAMILAFALGVAFGFFGGVMLTAALLTR